MPERPSYLKLVSHWNIFENQIINSRAWTLQEGLLSHRLVSFGSRVVKWSCRTESYGILPHDNALELHDDLAAVCSGMGRLSERELALKKVWAWSDVVKNYAGRDLSDDRDKLPAISGIASVLSAPAADAAKPEYQLDFVAGLLVHYPLAHPPSVQDSSAPEVRYHPQGHYESFLFALQLIWQDNHWELDFSRNEDWAILERQRRQRQKISTFTLYRPDMVMGEPAWSSQNSYW